MGFLEKIGLAPKQKGQVIADSETAPGLLDVDHAKVAREMKAAEDGTPTGRLILANQEAAAQAERERNGQA